MDMLVPDVTWARPQNRWTTEQRLFLCCMVRYFMKDNAAFAKIFYHAFTAQIKESGYVTEIPWLTLHTQWITMRRFGDHLWGAVNLSPFRKGGYGTWHPIIRKIQLIAWGLNINLVEKETDDIDTSNYEAQPPKGPSPHENAAAPNTVTPEAEAEELHTSQQLQATQETDQTQEETTSADKTNEPDGNTESPILVTAGGKFCLFCFQEGHMHSDLQSPTEEIPRLLYRWSNVDSQGVNSRRFYQAGLFAEGTEYLDPHELPQGEFNRFVEAHVRIDKTLSPFISTFRMMLAPMHRALRNGEGAIVSIIDSQKLITPVYSAQKLVRTLSLKFRFYKGIAEYLVWGKIPKSAIVCSFKASTFLNLARENPEFEELLQFENVASSLRCGNALHRVLGSGPGGLNHETGATIGRFLFKLEVPYEHCQNISQGMCRSWRMKKRGGSWEEFYAGVEDGYYSLNSHLDHPMPSTADEDEDEEMLDDVSTSERPEDSEFPGSSKQHQAPEMLDVSEDESPELPATPATPAFPDSPDTSDISGFSGFSEIFNSREEPDIPETTIHQSDDETVTNDDPRSSIDLFPSDESPSPEPAVIKLFDGATKQWIAQQEIRNDPISSGSSAETAISIDSDDEVDIVFSSQTRGVKPESSVRSSPPVLIDLEEVLPKKKKPIIATHNRNRRIISERENTIPATPKPHDRFAADRARVLRFWG